MIISQGLDILALYSYLFVTRENCTKTLYGCVSADTRCRRHCSHFLSCPSTQPFEGKRFAVAHRGNLVDECMDYVYT